jgi:hypothetical protein
MPNIRFYHIGGGTRAVPAFSTVNRNGLAVTKITSIPG